VSTISRLRRFLSVPERKLAEKIVRFTEGLVSYEDLYAPPPAPEEEKPDKDKAKKKAAKA
jgi:hypothetical protein